MIKVTSKSPDLPCDKGPDLPSANRPIVQLSKANHVGYTTQILIPILTGVRIRIISRGITKSRCD